MLRLLRIRNLAVIEAADVEFHGGFSVLTGETGAGKSILVQAVGLLLGGRASADLIRTGETTASIEAVFEDAGREIVLRREITAQGRSRALIDGAAATAGELRAAAARLIELHGQHEHQALTDPLTHLRLLDQYARLEGLAADVAGLWTEVRALRDQLDRRRMDARERAARLDLIAFQLAEIEKVAPRAGEDDALCTARQVLMSAERVQRLCTESYAALYESEGAVLEGLGHVWKRVAELAAIEPQFASYVQLRDGIKGQLEDLALFLRQYAEGVEASPVRLQEVEDRLAALERLKRKYGPTLDEVTARRQELAREQELLGGGSARLEDLEQALGKASDRYEVAARDLSRRRLAAAGELSRDVEALLAELAMARTRFEVRFGAEAGPGDWSERGIDTGEFYVSPNPGEDLRPLARIASGGELSRMMLALKTLGSSEAAARTLVFDEVDAGIGGRAADAVGARLRQLGEHGQVLCITHLPQIAARGTTHFRIEKVVRGGRTVTTVEELRDGARVDEIARMIGGEVETGAVRATARDLLTAAAGAKGESESRERKRK